MNENQLKGRWQQLKGKAKVKWGKLTDDELTTIDGSLDQLHGKIRERYGVAEEEAKRQVDQFFKDNPPDDGRSASAGQ